ncbi:aminotransferase class IV [Pseudoxanthomonas suwonensis]|uniref:Class IV aminotransferase n=1 Tax=Pseudoxanthomonas suwonensis TaxID=314722 RepID=A0A0E3Z4P0_9GAMM|nr:aminotransferase class IV [Pseudoxanthomonas suwonensis]AKC87558.1 class IV aminotransferase [Pseudoxanthomonas suwonensis]
MSAAAPVALLNGAPADAEPGALRALAQTNYGHFTALRVRDGAAQGLELHFARLRQGNAELFDAALDEAAARGWMRQAADAAGGDCAMRVTVFSRHFDYRQPLREVALDVLVSAAAPAAPSTRALRVRTCRFLRPLPQIKHVGTFPLFHHRRQALKAGYDDALFVDGEGADARIAEGSVWNIGFWDGAGVVWPEAPALRGTTERLLQDGLKAQGLAQQVRPVTLAELPRFRAAFATNANGVQPIAAIDSVEYADAPELMRLLAAAAAHAPWDPL